MKNINGIKTIIRGLVTSETYVEDETNLLCFALTTNFGGTYKEVNVRLKCDLPEEMSRVVHNKGMHSADVFVAGELSCFMDEDYDRRIFTNYEMDAEYIAFDV